MQSRPVREHPVDDHATVVTGDAQLVDVRQPEELVEGVLPGAVNIPLGELPVRVAELDRGRRVVVVCRSGGRSGRAAQRTPARRRHRR
ncbi:MAG: rhodanese-like domain-containing protein, partial [Ilumatobacteraceae bacterium]